MDFNGIRAVPVGPKTDLPQLRAETDSARPNVPIRHRHYIDQSIRAQPHAFISSRCLPARQPTVRHLEGYVTSFRRKPTGVYVDDSGYYITFPDTSKGHEDLDELVASCPTREPLFHMYTLHLEAYHQGQSACEPNAPVRHRDSSEQATLTNPTASSEAFLNPADTEEVDEDILPDAEDVELVLPVEPSRPAGRNHSPQQHVQLTYNGLEEQTAAELVSNVMGRSSPLTVPSRHDREDASSLSGKTTTSSDLSASKRLICHVCSTASAMDLDGLVSCTSCPRRYHRRCHTSPPIPSTVDGSVTRWQCRRCVKKHVAPPDLSSVGVAEADAAVSTKPHDERPAKRPRLHARHEESAPTSAAKKPGDSQGSLGGTRPTKPPEETPSTASDTLDAPALQDDRQPNSEDSNFDAAADLVEKSFATPAKDVTPGATPRKVGKSLFVRTKILRPVQSSSAHSADLESPKPATNLNQGAASKSATEPATGVSASPAESRSLAPSTAMRTAPEVARSSVGSRDEVAGDNPQQQPTRPGFITPRAADVAHSQESNGGSARVKMTAKRTPMQLVPCSKCAIGKAVSTNKLGKALCSKCKSLSAGTQIYSQGPATRIGERDQGTNVKPRTHLASTDLSERASKGQAASLILRKAGKQNDSNPISTAPGIHPPLATASLGRREGSRAIQTTPQVETGTDVERKEQDDLPAAHAGHARGQLDALTAPAVTIANTNSGTPRIEAEMAVAATTKALSNDMADDSEQRPLHPPKVTVADTESGTKEIGADAASAAIRKVPSKLLLHPPKPLRSIAGAEQGPIDDTSDSDEQLSEPPATSDRSTPGSTTLEAYKKRPRRNFIGGEGLGNGEKRPEGTYERLIRMALYAAPDHRLQIRGINHFITNNIAGYDMKAGTWVNGIGTTVSAHMGDKGKRLFKAIPWKTDDSKIHGDHRWIQLRSDVVDTYERWDPVLKQPVSLPPEWQNAHAAEAESDSGSHNSTPEAETEPERAETSASLAVRERCAKARAAKADAAAKRTKEAAANRIEEASRASSTPDASDPMEIDESFALTGELESAKTVLNRAMPIDRVESSDDEPLARSRRDRNRSTNYVAPAAMMQPTPTLSEEEDKPQKLVILRNPPLRALPPTPSAEGGPKPQRLPHTGRAHADDLSLAQLIKLEADNIDYTAKSLFDEWPEFDPANSFDKEAKIAEIKKRPSRKQMFKKPAMYSRLCSNDDEPASKPQATRTSTPNSFCAAERTGKALRRTFPLQENLTHYDTLEEFFGLPANPMPFIHHGQLAYRDGTRGENGELPRAKIIYKTGPY